MRPFQIIFNPTSAAELARRNMMKYSGLPPQMDHVGVRENTMLRSVAKKGLKPSGYVSRRQARALFRLP